MGDVINIKPKAIAVLFEVSPGYLPLDNSINNSPYVRNIICTGDETLISLDVEALMDSYLRPSDLPVEDVVKWMESVVRIIVAGAMK